MIRAKLSIFLAIATVHATTDNLSLSIQGNRATLFFGGEPGSEYVVGEATEISSGADADGHNHSWRTLGSVRLTGDSGQWQMDLAPSGNRFYRVGLIDSPNLAANFRLIDQNGVSRELKYYQPATDIRAIVLTFADGNYSAFASKIAALKNNATYANSVLFWTIDVGEGKTRAQIAAAATAAGITWPVFQDPKHLVTADYDAHFSGETFLISRANMRIAYRGAIDDGAGNNYLATALSTLFANQPIAITRVEPTTGEIAHVERPIADYGTVIAPLLQAKCVTCHSPDNIAPFAMTSYDVVKNYAALIKSQVMAKKMPPWHADPIHGNFRNDVSLTEEERATLIDWIDAGTPPPAAGDPLTVLPPEPPEWPVELGPPDEIVTIPAQSIPATGTVAYRYIYANAANPTQRWVKAAIVKPSNRRVVHHYLVWQGHVGFGIDGMAGYAPGRTESAYPDGTGVSFPANCPLTFNLHYTATGTAETDQPKLGLWYHATPPARALLSAYPFNAFFTIPAQARDHQVTASQTFNQAATIFSFNPHMHHRGSRMKFELVLPNGSRSIVASIPKYDFMWQTIYYLAQPLEIPAGSTINVIGAFDNSSLNLALTGPNMSPNNAVYWGDQSWEEMFIGYIQFAYR